MAPPRVDPVCHGSVADELELPDQPPVAEVVQLLVSPAKEAREKVADPLLAEVLEYPEAVLDVEGCLNHADETDHDEKVEKAGMVLPLDETDEAGVEALDSALLQEVYVPAMAEGDKLGPEVNVALSAAAEVEAPAPAVDEVAGEEGELMVSDVEAADSVVDPVAMLTAVEVDALDRMLLLVTTEPIPVPEAAEL